MRVLLLGVGMQGKAALDDLVAQPDVEEILAADRDLEALEEWVSARGYGDRVRCKEVDATDPAGLRRLFSTQPDVAVDLLPVAFIGPVAQAAVDQGVHLVNTFYVVPELAALEDRAQAAGVTILPELGMDPGIDLVLLGECVRRFDTVEAVTTYGAGFPEPEAACTSPIGYKVTWTFEGVMKSYHRAARVIRDGRVVDIPARAMFAPEHIHRLVVDGLGRFEAFPNGDALPFARKLGLDTDRLKDLGRYVLRWPGHCAFWQTVNDLHLLDEEPVLVDGRPVDRRRFLAAAMEPHLQYKETERDVVVVRIDVVGTKDGRRRRCLMQMVDRRDLQTGLMAMNRTVGFPAAIGAAMIARGTITRRGILSPLEDVPYDAFVEALQERGIAVEIQEGE